MFDHFQLCFVNEAFLMGRVNVFEETQPDISVRCTQRLHSEQQCFGGRV